MVAKRVARVQAAIGEPRLARNIRGQVAAALHCLEESDDKRLACDFAEHALSFVCAGDSLRVEIYQRGIDTIRAFFAGHATIQQVDEAYVEAMRLEPIGSQGIPVVLHDFWSVQYLLFRCCCQREFEAAKLVVRYKYQPGAISVAQAACWAVARRAGGPDWDSLDPLLQQAARARGRRASDDEARWQLQRVLDDVLAYHE